MRFGFDPRDNSAKLARYNRQTTACPKCGREINTPNYERHVASCKGIPASPKPALDRMCKYCPRKIPKDAVACYRHGERSPEMRALDRKTRAK